MKITAAFVTSAAGAGGFPTDGRPEIALVGRSNVGKSSLINALVRQRVARTSAAPGKTRLANIYEVAKGHAEPLYLVDLPGYGYARGGGDVAGEFAALTQAYFGRERRQRRDGQEGPDGTTSLGVPASPAAPDLVAALLLVDARHPGLESDRQACAWLRESVTNVAIVATKIDKLPRGQRIRARSELESVFEDSVLPVSAITGEGLDELWNLIDKVVNSNSPNRHSSRSRPPKAMVPRLPKRARHPPKK